MPREAAPCPSMAANERPITCRPIPMLRNSPCVRMSAGIPHAAMIASMSKIPRPSENNCRPPTDPLVCNTFPPAKDRQCGERRRDGGWKTRGKIVFAKRFKARDLHPVGEWRFVQAQVIIEMRNDVVAPLDHLARGFGEARLIAVNQRQTPRTDRVKHETPEK